MSSGARPAKADGVRATGNNKPYANMPANNVGTFPVSLGNTHSSKFATPGGPGQGSVSQGNGTKVNMPAHNKTGTRGAKKNMGTTKHAPGTVPGYLKG